MKFKVLVMAFIILLVILILIDLRPSASRTVHEYLVLAGKEDKSISRLYTKRIQNEISLSLTDKEIEALIWLRVFEDFARICGESKSIKIWGESISGETAKVVATYNCKGLKFDYVFTMIKEGDEWKIETMDFMGCRR